jgi:hypothetical protein
LGRDKARCLTVRLLIPPTKPCMRLSPHTAFQESAFHMAACCTTYVIRVPFAACPTHGSHGVPRTLAVNRYY